MRFRRAAALKDRHPACLAVRILPWPVDVAEPQRDMRRIVEALECTEVSLARELCCALGRERKAWVALEAVRGSHHTHPLHNWSFPLTRSRTCAPCRRHGWPPAYVARGNPNRTQYAAGRVQRRRGPRLHTRGHCSSQISGVDGAEVSGNGPVIIAVQAAFMQSWPQWECGTRASRERGRTTPEAHRGAKAPSPHSLARGGRARGGPDSGRLAVGPSNP